MRKFAVLFLSLLTVVCGVFTSASLMREKANQDLVGYSVGNQTDEVAHEDKIRALRGHHLYPSGSYPPRRSAVKKRGPFPSLSKTDPVVSGFIPPDPHGAAGPKSLIAVVNVAIEARDRDGKEKWTAPLSSFFSSFNTKVFDPKIIYDIHKSKFAVVTLETAKEEKDCSSQTSKILLAVSSNSNPDRHDWRYQHINATPLGYWADYPGFEVDEEVIYITANIYECGKDFAYSKLWIVQKKDLSSTAIDLKFSKLKNRFTYQPAEVRAKKGAGKGVGTYLLALNQYEGSTKSFLSIVRIRNPTGEVKLEEKTIPLGHVHGKTLTAPQLGSPHSIHAGYTNKLLDAVWHKDSIWATATSMKNGEVTATWMQIDVSNWHYLKIKQIGEISGEEISANAHTYYPSVAVNKDGIAAFGFSASGKSIYAGAYFTWRHPTDKLGQTRQVETVVAGVAPYYSRDTKGRNRWGDYTGISVDPSDEDCFWVYNQFASTPCNSEPNGRWTTAWAQFCIKLESREAFW